MQVKQMEKGGRKHTLRDPSNSQAMKDMLKMKYVMGVETSQAGDYYSPVSDHNP
jgi:hypothetical protein